MPDRPTIALAAPRVARSLEHGLGEVERQARADAAEELDGARRLLGAIAKLPLEQRVVLGLAVGDELPCAEIAGILGVPEGTVSSRLHAAREGLRARLERR